MTGAGSVSSADRPTLKRYIVAETLVGAAINTVMSVAFTWIFFHGHAVVPTSGHGANLIVDAAPQSFMVALMSILPVSLLTRARARRGRPLPLAPTGGWRGPKILAIRSVCAAVAAAVVGVAGFWLLAPPLAPNGMPFAHAMILKAVYGAALSFLIIPFAAIAALKDVP